jgi:radical SAM protein with 4Fe4S-binding SPASM domain
MAKPYQQEPPFCVQVELTEGCNLQCTFCGIQGIREKAGGPFKYMTESTARKAAEDMAVAEWNSRIEFAMHGEPSMNPDMAKIVGIFRNALPKAQLMMTSNGAGFMKDTTERITALFDAGLNILALDDYQNVKIVPKVRERYTGSAPVFDYPTEGLDISPHRRHPRGTQMILIIQDISVAKAGSHAQINNHAGFGAAKNYSKAHQRCAKPFRELGVRWDGAVAGCCVDWTGAYKIGNVNKDTIDALWQSPAFNAMRRKLYHGQRDFGPCNGCDHLTSRLGLLPDKLGRKSLPKPTAEDAAIIKRALGGQPFTPLVLKPFMEGRDPAKVFPIKVKT